MLYIEVPICQFCCYLLIIIVVVGLLSFVFAMTPIQLNSASFPRKYCILFAWKVEYYTCTWHIWAEIFYCNVDVHIIYVCSSVTGFSSSVSLHPSYNFPCQIVHSALICQFHSFLLLSQSSPISFDVSLFRERFLYLTLLYAIAPPHPSSPPHCLILSVQMCVLTDNFTESGDWLTR